MLRCVDTSPRAPTLTLPIGLFAACAAALAPASAQAALGGDVDSVRRDHAAIHAADAVTTTPHYDVHDGIGAGGMRIREYVDRGGKVFAVRWRGPHSPDLNNLLGIYAARYVAMAHAHRGAHHVLVIADRDLSVSVLRLPRGWQGQASLPQALPPGVSGAEIR